MGLATTSLIVTFVKYARTTVPESDSCSLAISAWIRQTLEPTDTGSFCMFSA